MKGRVTAQGPTKSTIPSMYNIDDIEIIGGIDKHNYSLLLGTKVNAQEGTYAITSPRTAPSFDWMLVHPSNNTTDEIEEYHQSKSSEEIQHGLPPTLVVGWHGKKEIGPELRKMRKSVEGWSTGKPVFIFETNKPLAPYIYEVVLFRN